MNKTCLLLIAHGSKDPNWVSPFRKLAADLRREAGQDGVYLSFMENSEPSIPEAAEQIVAAGFKKCRALPLFMAPGAHIHEDIPAVVKEIQARHPELTIEMQPPIGQHPAFLDLMRKLTLEAISQG